MNIWLAVFLFLHVMGAIIAFGPTYAFPIIGAMGGKEPQHANFATRVTETIVEQRVLPLAIFQGITGVALILVTGINLATPWLLIGIVLYLIVLGFNYFIGTPRVKKIIEMTSAPPPPGASGPPPELLALIKQVQRGGMFSGLMVLVIVILMVTKPTF